VAQKDADGLTLHQGGNTVFIANDELQALRELLVTTATPSKARLMRYTVRSAN
jgi:hypothetical protein